MPLATLEQVMVDIAGSVERVTLGVDPDGLTVGDYGKLMWQGARVVIEPDLPRGCRLRVVSAAGPGSVFFVPTEAAGGPEGIRMLCSWLTHNVTRAGATVEAVDTAA